jgi:FecR protein
MKSTHFFRGAAVTLAALIATNFAFADPPSRVARLSFIEGDVSFAPTRAPKDDNWAAAKINWPITEGNRLYAGDNARAELHIGASALRLTENTALDVSRLDDEHIETFLDRGSLSLTLRNWDRDDELIVTTPNLSVTLNSNGRYRIDVDGDNVNVVVRQGEARVQNGGSRFNVIASQRAEIEGRDGDDVRITRDDDEDNFDRWAAERDSRQNVATSSRYVAPTTPGVYELDQYGRWQETSEYGHVWRPNNVADDWAPYRHGRWEWIAPWGWTWIDDAPWGYAPSHYGRWVYVDRYWAWHPGRIVARPVYAPALVSFISGPGFSVSVSTGQPCGWVPLAPYETYYPYYQSSHRYVERINVTHVHRDHVIEREYHHDRGHHRNRDYPGGVTIVNPRVVIGHLPVAGAALPFERHLLRDIARIAPPLPPLPRIGALLPRPFERHVERDRPRDENRWRHPERKFQTGGPTPIRHDDQRHGRGRDRDERHWRPDYQIPRHEVDTRVPLVIEDRRFTPVPGIVRERPVGERPLPQNVRPLPYNDKPLPQNNRPLPAPRAEPRSDGHGSKWQSGSAPVRKMEKWMATPR